METGLISLRFELLLLLGLVIMVVFLLIIVTFSWFHQKKRGKEENRQFTAKSEYQRKLQEARIQHEEKERFRFAKDLRQELDALQISAGSIKILSENAAESEVRQKLEELATKLEQSGKKIEAVSRQIAPAFLLESGLSNALESLVLQYNKEGKADLYLLEKGYKKQDDLVEIMLFRIGSEIISNALRHGKPNRIDIELKGNDEQIVLEIRDNGLPFDLQKQLSENNITSSGNGLKNIESRLQNNAALIYSHLDGTNRNRIIWAKSTEQ